MLQIIDIPVRAKLLHVVYASIEQKKRMKVVLRLKVRGPLVRFIIPVALTSLKS